MPAPTANAEQREIARSRSSRHASTNRPGAPGAGLLKIGPTCDCGLDGIDAWLSSPLRTVALFQREWKKANSFAFGLSILRTADFGSSHGACAVSKYVLRLYTDQLQPGAVSAALAETERVIYIAYGDAVCRGHGFASSLAPNSVWQGRLGITLTGGSKGVRLLRWELSTSEPRLLTGAGVTSVLTLAGEPGIEAGINYLMRCDRVDFPPGGVAFTHTHQGSGIRCLQAGRICIETQSQKFWVEPGNAWFETGHDPVFAQTRSDGPSHFVRVMILPQAIRGKSSIRYLKPEDVDKPKTQTYQVFTDEPIQLYPTEAQSH